MKLIFADPAIAQAEFIDAWWRANRPATRHAFAQDFAAVLASILAMPRVMAPFTDKRGRTVRRWLLPRTKHHVYYTVDDSAQVVRIMAVWGGPRGSAPRLP